MYRPENPAPTTATSTSAGTTADPFPDMAIRCPPAAFQQAPEYLPRLHYRPLCRKPSSSAAATWPARAGCRSERARRLSASWWSSEMGPSGHQDDLAEGGPARGLGQFHGRGHLSQRVAGGDLRGEHAVAQEAEQVREIGAQLGPERFPLG